MKILRFLDLNGEEHYGTPVDESSAEVLVGDPYDGFSETGDVRSIGRYLAPIEPAAIICIGLNYRFHAQETKAPVPTYPIVFFKNPSALSAHREPIRLPGNLKSNSVDYECELVVVIGKTCLNATKENALDYVLGYTAGNDVSARDWQKSGGGGQWSRGKSFDSFCPLGPVLVTKDELNEPNRLKIRTLLNDEVMQDWNTDDMIFDVPTLIEFLSADMTLKPGTVIMTGTPQGVGMARVPPVWLKPGDTVTVEVESIGHLTNPVIETPEPKSVLA